MAGLQPPPPFLPTPGSPPIPWGQWKSLFDTYMLASAASKFNEDRRCALLLHCLGPEGQRIFHTLPPSANAEASGADLSAAGGTAASYQETVKRLEKHFSPTINVVAERYRFRQRAQRPAEPVDDYISALRALSTTCEFGALQNELIRDQVVEKTSSEKVRERLLMEPKLTLDSAIQIARQTESAMREAKNLAESNFQDQANVHAVGATAKFKPRSNTTGKQYFRQNQFRGKPSHSQSSISCYRCGDPNHKANDKCCPAKDASCRNCGKTGHFAKVCRSQPVRQISEQFDNTTSTAHASDSTCTCSSHTPISHVQVLNTCHALSGNIMCQVFLNDNVPVNMVFDTGSAVSLLPAELFHKNFVQELLHPVPATVSFVTYLQEPIPVSGVFETSVRFGDTVAQGRIYIVERGEPILGRDLISALQLIMQDNMVKRIRPAANDTNHSSSSDADTMTAAYPLLFQDRIGTAKGFVHQVRTKPDVNPVQQKLRRLPFAVRDKVSQELKRLEAADIIEKIDSSEWVSPMVVAYKRSGDVRLCVDLREVNKAILIDKYPLPHIQELIAELRGSTVFSTLDLTSAYHQLLLHEDSRDLTAFITQDGLFRFKRVCFGLASAPSAFQKLMSSSLAGLPGVQCYLDDVVIYGRTLEEHDKHLTAVLQRLQDIGLTLNLQKCQFRVTSIRFLGHMISTEGLHPDPSRVDDILETAAPTDLATLRSFLGLSSYYARFIHDYATVTEPLRALTRKNTAFEWSPAAQKAFDHVKHEIAHATALHLFDPELPTIVETDASAYGLGAVLLQVKDGQEFPVAFASKTLCDAERNYSVGEKEALACVWACEKWFTYVWGRRFTLRTDHQSLCTLLATRGTNRQSMRIARWSARLMRFNFAVEYCRGSQNYTADALSRLPVREQVPVQDCDEEIVIQSVNALFASSVISKADLQRATAEDSTLTTIMTYVASGWPSKNAIPASVQPFYKLRDELSVVDGCLMRGERCVIPAQLHNKLISAAHAAHQGIVRTKQRLRELFWWPAMDKAVEEAIATCDLCQTSDKVGKTRNTPLQPVPLPPGPWKKLGIDITGPFESTRECKYAIVLIDYYSKWVELAFVPEVTSRSVITFLSQVFAREGLPSEIVSDNGTQFVSAEFEAFLANLQIRHLKSSLYYPRANGEVERWNRVLKQTLQIAKNERKPWKDAAIELLMAYRATPHQTTGKSPAELLHGRKMVTPVNIRDVPEAAPDDADVRARVTIQQEKARKYTDSKRSAAVPKFCVGDTVRYKTVRKGGPKFSAPHRIVANKGPYTYQLDDGRTWNASKLTSYKGYDHSVSQSRPMNETENRPKRNTKLPIWSRDYEMKK